MGTICGRYRGSRARQWARPASVELPFFREQSYHALSRQDAARWAYLGAYRA